MSEQTAKPIPTQLNIAPLGKTWKNWELVDGTDGFPTRESMEKYLCNPERVRELEECRDLNLATIKQLNNLLQCSGCAVQQGYVPVETLSAEIKEPQKFTGDSEMRRAFEIEYGQSWVDPDWRKETGIWASAWHKATASAQLAAVQQAQAWHSVWDVLQEVKPGFDDCYPLTGQEAAIKAIRELAAVQQGVQPDWRATMKDMVDAMRLYEMDVDGPAPEKHRAMMNRAKKLLATHPTQQGLDAPTLDDAWKARLLDGRELERDEYGFGFHPELPEVQESTDVRKFFELFGIEVQCASADEDLDCEEYDRMSGTDPEGPFNFTDWKPSAPDGEGWKLVSIHDTEDGPYAMWLRALAAQAKHGGV